LRISREGQVTDRFTHAIDQLGSATLDVRLGGIYALERIAKDSPRDHGPIMEVLTAFVRQHAPWKDNQPPAEAGHRPKPPADIQAVLIVLGRRVIDEKWQEPRRFMIPSIESPGLDLSKTDLRGTILAEAHLEGADLSYTHLENAYLRGAHLEKAFIGGAHLEGANLIEAHLEGASFPGAHLEKAFITGAHLENANLRRAHLKGARLEGAHLERADLHEAYLEGANLIGAHLEGADLREAYLEEAFIGEAHLEGALNLTKEQIDSAYTDLEQWLQALAKTASPLSDGDR
jgi:uncharacterized protein YjbI with pentapeptide repeats